MLKKKTDDLAWGKVPYLKLICRTCRTYKWGFGNEKYVLTAKILLIDDFSFKTEKPPEMAEQGKLGQDRSKILNLNPRSKQQRDCQEKTSPVSQIFG